MFTPNPSKLRGINIENTKPQGPLIIGNISIMQLSQPNNNNQLQIKIFYK